MVIVMKTRLKLWAALVLCLCALLVCGCALAEGQQYTASVANFGQLVPNTCERIVLYDRSNEYISEEGGSFFVEPTKMIGVRIYPQANCSVVSVVCNKEDYGEAQEGRRKESGGATGSPTHRTGT